MVLTQAASTPMMDKPWFNTPIIQCANHSSRNGADITGDCSATDEASCDGVHFEFHTGLCSGGSQARQGDDCCDRGQEAHVQEDLEIGRLGIDAGKNGGLAVATDGVDVAAVNRAVQREPVDADQHADNEHHNRNATLSGVTGATAP